MFRELLIHYLVKKFCIIFLLIVPSFLYYSFPQNISSKFPTPTFEYISSEDGLPENSVTCILQDHLGYLWLGTLNGLVRYDGYSMKVFQHDKNDSSSISNGSISALYEDKNKTLWIGTWHGLNKLNREDDSFKSYKYNPNDTNSINSNRIKCIYEDANGRFWIGTTEGLNLFDRDKQIFTRYFFRDSDYKLYTTSISGKHNLSVNSITEDRGTGYLLVGTNSVGLWKFKIKEKIFTKYKFNTADVPDKKIGRIQSLYKSRDGKIWIASSNALSSLDPRKKEFKSYVEFPITDKEQNLAGTVIEDRFGFIWFGFWALDNGVFCLNPNTGNYRQYKFYPDKPEGRRFNTVYSIYEDRLGIIWVGTWELGLQKWDKMKHKFHILKHDPLNKNSLSDTWVGDMKYDSNGFLWFLTKNGLDKYDPKTDRYWHYLENLKSFMNTYTIPKFIIDRAGIIWIFGIRDHEIISFNPQNKIYRIYLNNPKDSINLINKKVETAFLDHLGIIWIGTQYSGLYSYDIFKNKLKNYKHEPNNPSSLSENRVNVALEDNFGTLWFGTNLGGLDKFERKTEKFTYCGFSTILAIYEDKNSNFWVSDYFTGLNLFDRKENKVISSYGEKEGLLNHTIYGILEDENNNLWMGTEIGLSKFSIKKKTFRNYTKDDGLPASRLLWPFPKDASGIMYFNTLGGIIYFNPDSIKDDPVPPKVVINRVSLFNKPGEKIKYKGFISKLKEITLPYYQNDLRFDFVGLQFREPEKNKYKLFLENFDKDWVDAGTQRNAVYTNLDPGKYIFRVNAANKDGIWNTTGASITIIITPPWWETTYAYIIYVIIIISIIYSNWRFKLKRIREKHEYEMSKFEAEKLLEVDELKSRFFTNISHEFRTPLTLILGPIKQIIEKIKDEKIKNELQIVHKNAKSLLGLVNELLDISKLESGNMKLQASPQNIIPLLKALVHSFCSYAERKRINLKFNCDEEEIIAYADKEKIEKIITNLLSNAFKFTPEEGEIEVSVRTISKSILTDGVSKSKIFKPLFLNNKLPPPLEEREVGSFINFLEIYIRDNGIGIPKENISKIFDRFYRVNGSHTREKEGTGIGLSLTKELIELHKGKIEVESEEGKGTTFTISIPLGKDYLKPEEICETEKVEAPYDSAKPVIIDEDKIDLPAGKAGKPVFKQIKDIDKPMLLITEDNYDVRNYIKENLNKDYKILEAIDGEDGWNKSIDNIPDLIISDVMMPKMDGFQLCNKLKADERTSHIPVILLTAKAAKQDKIEGFETGADEYITKPFEPDELLARIKNLIEQRKRIHDYFKKHSIIELEESKITSADKRFLKKVFDTIANKMSDPSFNVESLSESIAVSRSVLHKKTVSLLGEPPIEVIRRMRVTRGAELIEKKFGNISEIALEVGFNNPANFSEYFKKQFGVVPSQYKG